MENLSNIQGEYQLFDQKLKERCWKDNLFFKEFKAEPLKVLNKLSDNGFKLRDGKKEIIVEDQTDPNKIYLNIPSRPNFDNFDDFVLTDEQLELVAGGIGPVIAISTLVWIGAGVIVGGTGIGLGIAWLASK